MLKPGGRFAVSDVVTRGEVPAEIRQSMVLWVGCIAGALSDFEYVAKLARAGFEAIDIEPTRVYDIEDARTFPERPGRRRRCDRADQVRGQDSSARSSARRSQPRRLLRPGLLRVTSARRITAEASARRCCSRRWSAPASWASGSPGATSAIALLANTLATGAMLVALILTFGPISGAHFNPAVTLADASQGGMPWREVPGYLAAQLVGAFAGVAAAHLMFGEPLFSASQHVRAGGSQSSASSWQPSDYSAVIWGCARLRSAAVPFAVGAYITGAYWFTASTSFANPAVTLARAASNTFSGIRPGRRAGLHRRPAARRRRGNAALSLAGAVAGHRTPTPSWFPIHPTGGPS